MNYTKSSTMKHYALITGFVACGLSGCGMTPLQADYGRSVTQMTDNQVYDRAASTHPSTAPVEGADPDLLNAAVTEMRIPASDRKEVAKPMTINIGGRQ